jgi:hypothetical protein
LLAPKKAKICYEIDAEFPPKNGEIYYGVQNCEILLYGGLSSTKVFQIEFKAHPNLSDSKLMRITFKLIGGCS